MEFGKRVVIAVDIAKEARGRFDELKEIHFSSGSDVHLVYVFQEIGFNFAIDAYSMAYPLADDRLAIEKSVNEALKKIGQEVLPKDVKVHTHCIFSENQKEKLCEVVEEIKADVVILAARKRHGIFESSFAQYMLKHSERNLLILKDRQSV